MLTFHAIGDWSEDDVSAVWAADTRRRVPDVEVGIERHWVAASERLGPHLFDGPMCRLEQLKASEESLRLWLSPTTYKTFLGTNLLGGDEVPLEALANPVGLSAALATSDGWLMLGRRNANVAYYPDRIHPFAGSLEPSEVSNVFGGVRRELAEELRFTPGDAAGMRCIGVVRDRALRQPELIFAVRSTRTRGEVERMVDAKEHRASVAVEQSPAAVETMLRDPALTPVCVGTLLLWGRIAFGEVWFDRVKAPR